MIKLSHIGEILIAKLIEDSSLVMKKVCHREFHLSESYKVLPEMRLNKCGELIFDGAHKIDVAVLNLSSRICYPIEAKLGFDRLGKNEFEKRFLDGCGTSHNNTRIRGSMISVLERKLPAQYSRIPITVTFKNTEYVVSNHWSLICREAVIGNWANNGGPKLSRKCSVVSFESIVRSCGDRTKFNRLVSGLLTKDYYLEWVQNA